MQASVSTHPKDLKELALSAERELTQNILPFWQVQAPSITGKLAFQGEVSHDLVADAKADRGMLLSARILWTFSAAHLLYPDRGYLAIADAAYSDLEYNFRDLHKGGYFWSLSHDGKITDGRKQVYGHSFAIYGLAEYHRASGRPEALERAKEIFSLLEQHSHDATNLGYIEAFNSDWKRPHGQVMSIIGPDFAKSQNTHLHLMEAFSNLLKQWDDPLLRTRLREVTELMITKVVSPDGTYMQLYFDADWTPRSNRCSPGHDIEANWLLCEAADTLGDEAFRARVRACALGLTQAVLDKGVDKDGGIWNERDPKGLTNAGKDWWNQAEAAVGFVNSYELSKDPVHLQAALKVWAFTLDNLVDREAGEWHYGMDAAGRVITSRPKLSMWKCPYHNARACMELLRRCKQDL